MALVKCKECGAEISSKAKTCPKCGAMVPKKTSLVTWLFLFLIIVIIISANLGPTKNNSSSTINSSQNSQTNTKVVPPKPSWSTSTSKDKMTGKFSAFASSPTTYPTKQMSFPYNNVNSWIGVGCDGESEWAYFGFNLDPNLSGTETKNGYNLISTRIKWDKKVENIDLTQQWGAKFIHFQNGSAAISDITSSNKVLLELNWHGEGTVYFEYSLRGSSKAISKIRAECAAKK